MPLHYISFIEHVAGSIAGASSLAVIVTYGLFPALRRLRYMELVFYVAINDLVGSIGIALGPVPSGSFACWFQGLSSNFCYVSATFWTTVISYQVWLVIIGKPAIQDMKVLHSICWGIPLLATLLPLSTNTYGHYQDEGYWCYISDRKNSPQWGYQLWSLFAFYLWVWLALLLSLMLLLRITWRLRQMKQQIPEVVQYTLRKLRLYPIITLVCWGLNTICKVYFLFSNSSRSSTSSEADYVWDKIYIASIGIGILQGLFNAMVFFSMNPNVQQRWWALLRGDLRVVQQQWQQQQEGDSSCETESRGSGSLASSGIDNSMRFSSSIWQWSKSLRSTTDPMKTRDTDTIDTDNAQLQFTSATATAARESAASTTTATAAETVAAVGDHHSSSSHCLQQRHTISVSNSGVSMVEILTEQRSSEQLPAAYNTVMNPIMQTIDATPSSNSITNTRQQ